MIFKCCYFTPSEAIHYRFKSYGLKNKNFFDTTDGDQKHTHTHTHTHKTAVRKS